MNDPFAKVCVLKSWVIPVYTHEKTDNGSKKPEHLTSNGLIFKSDCFRCKQTLSFSRRAECFGSKLQSTGFISETSSAKFKSWPQFWQKVKVAYCHTFINYSHNNFNHVQTLVAAHSRESLQNLALPWSHDPNPKMRLPIASKRHLNLLKFLSCTIRLCSHA